MNNTSCKYYNADRESCPFDYGCDEDCYFAHKKQREYNEEYNELQEEFEYYKNSKEDEISELQSENEDYEDEIRYLEDKIETLESQQNAEYQETELYSAQEEKIKNLQNYCKLLQQEIKKLKGEADDDIASGQNNDGTTNT